MLFAARTDNLEAAAQWLTQFADQPAVTPP